MTDAPELDLDEIRARLDAACAELDRMTQADGGPGAAWRWSIPANPERDSDLLLSASLADVERLLAALDEARAERDKLQRAAKTLGGIVEQNARMILDITGLHDWIDEDGDGDWGAVWENAYELLPRLRAAESSLAAVRAGIDTLLADLAKAEPKHFSIGLMGVRVKGLAALVASTTERGGQ